MPLQVMRVVEENTKSMGKKESLLVVQQVIIALPMRWLHPKCSVKAMRSIIETIQEQGLGLEFQTES